MAARSDRRRRNKRRLADRQVYKNLKEAERLLGILLNDCHHQDNDSGRRRKRPNAECSDDADLRRAYKKWVRKRAKTAAKEVRERKLKWSGVGITFDKGDCQDNSDLSGRNPITVNPIMDGYQVHDVLMDGGSSLNVITAETLDELCISRFDMEPVICSFEGVMPGISATSIGQIWISVQLGTPENFRIEHVLFDVVDTNVQLHFTAILGRPAIAQFMAVLHHA